MKMKFKSILGVLFFYSASATADGLVLSIGKSTPRYSDYKYNDAIRLTYLLPVKTEFIPYAKNNLSLDLEFSYLNWKDNSNKWGSFHSHWYDRIEGIAITPFFKYQLDIASPNFDFFLGAGIGISYRNGSNWGYRDLGSRWLFEDKIEMSTIYKKVHQFSLSLIHYSNANLNKDNQGANIYGVGYGFHW